MWKGKYELRQGQSVTIFDIGVDVVHEIGFLLFELVHDHVLVGHLIVLYFLFLLPHLQQFSLPVQIPP